MDNLSIIIPVKRGDSAWMGLVTDLLSYTFQFEILVVSEEDLSINLSDPRIKYIHSKEGRARQQNNGVLQSTKTFLWFLHADSQISKNSFATIASLFKKNPAAMFYFDLKFLSDGPQLMAINSLGVKWRSQILKMPFGDQGFFMAKKTFFSMGAFDESAKYGEDHLLIWKAHQRNIPVLPCHDRLLTSARKYKKSGWLKTTSKHLYLTYKQAAPEWIKLLKLKNKKRPTTAVAIFVKTPGVSTVKSRLASSTGVEKAEEFFHLSLKATEEFVIEAMKKSHGEIEAFWAVAETQTLQHPLWDFFQTIPQGTGDLGDRLFHVYSKLIKNHDRVFLIGADLPHLGFNTLLKAHQTAMSHDQFIIGETDDGGFYLFGGKKPIERTVWNSITYSSDQTSEELKTALGKENFIFLDKNFDIDFVEDLKRLSDLKNDNLLPKQKKIVEWAKINTTRP
ncbi:MAG: DUF2064 domain-containing protein [Rhizobacter sp.]|nr:DUF2064 domain-containing protein [Bacteriovorax sp.]